MKILKDHYEYMETAINELLAIHNGNNELVECYEKGNFNRAYAVNDLQKRFCFDVFFGAGLVKFACDELYSYMNDDHIYTALKSICPKVVKRY